MTLKEKFKKQKIYINPYDFKLTKEGVESFEKIAEDFAIGFAEWMRKNTIYNGSEYYAYIGNSQQYKLNKLLEIYKKEKGL